MPRGSPPPKPPASSRSIRAARAAAEGAKARGGVGLVLAGGAARGAYEVGVVGYVLEEGSRALGRDVPIDVLCGTSAGSLNACMLAAHADKPVGRGQMLANRWANLRLEDVIRPSTRERLPRAGRLIGRSQRPMKDPRAGRRGGIFDPIGVENIIHDSVRFETIGE